MCGIYERPTTDRIRRIYQVVEASSPRWTFEACMREAAQEALVVPRYEADERMAHLQYCYFSSRAEEGEEAICYLLEIMTPMGASLIK
jgi:hypothetical protein